LSATAAWRPDWFGLNYASLIHIAAISIPFQLITLIGLNILLAVGKVRQFNILDLISQSFVLINAVLVWLLIRGDLGTLVLWNTVTSVFVSIVIALLLVISAKSLAQ